jgi:integrase/recombinase XerD
VETWLLTGDINRHSPRTIAARRHRMGLLVRFLQSQEYPDCGRAEILRFFSYLAHQHESGAPRWGNEACVRCARPTSSGYAKTLHATFRTFFRWLLETDVIPANPMTLIKPPLDRPDQVQPFTNEQLLALIAAAKRPRTATTARRGDPRRDEAVVLLLLDTGLRASEMCDLRLSDVDWVAGTLWVRSGKGGKGRSVPFSTETKRVLFLYTRSRQIDPTTAADADEALFLSSRGRRAGEGINPSGLKQLIYRLGEAAGITRSRCSPHTFRHTFAVSFLRNGGNVFTLKEILGHTTLTMVNKYVALAEADITRQHAQFSPVARLRGKQG